MSRSPSSLPFSTSESEERHGVGEERDKDGGKDEIRGQKHRGVRGKTDRQRQTERDVKGGKETFRIKDLGQPIGQSPETTEFRRGGTRTPDPLRVAYSRGPGPNQ